MIPWVSSAWPMSQRCLFGRWKILTHFDSCSLCPHLFTTFMLVPSLAMHITTYHHLPSPAFVSVVTYRGSDRGYRDGQEGDRQLTRPPTLSGLLAGSIPRPLTASSPHLDLLLPHSSRVVFLLWVGACHGTIVNAIGLNGSSSA